LATYFVTGCAGFIGWRVTEFLLADGHTVVGVDNLNDAYDVRLKHWRLDQIKGRPNFTFRHLDICNREVLRGLFDQQSEIRNPKFDAVINLAARAGVRQSVENPWVYYETNVTGTLNLLELCREFGVRKFVLASTSSLYGAKNTQPFREDANTDGPLSPYAASKKAAEALCYTYHYLYGMDVVVLRYFTVYGPAGRPDMSLFRFVQWISEGRPVIVYGDGQQARDFTYVDDIARGTIAAVHYLQTADDRRTTAGTTTDRRQPTAVIRGIGDQRSVVGGPVFEIINLGSDRPVVLMDAIRLVEELVGKKANIEYRPRHPADVLATWADIGKAERLLGWRPETRFREGIVRLVVWYLESRGWAREIATR
jgi:nucleoside-diphosphate-sugar epimerase